MKNLSFKIIGRSFLGFSIACIGLLHFFIPGFQRDILPISPEETLQIFPFLIGSVFILAGFAIIANKHTKVVSLSLGLLLILLLIFGHLPIQLNNQPEMLKSWTPTVKLLALTGGLLVLSYVSDENVYPPAFEKIYRLTRYGKYFFALQLIIFGLAHCFYAERLQNIIPEWMVIRQFLVFATGIALMGSGLSIFLNFKVRLTTLLLAVMFFSWLFIIHIPSLIKFPIGDGSLTISCLQCLAACGISLLIYELATSSQSKTLPRKFVDQTTLLT